MSYYDLYLIAFIDRKVEEKNNNFPDPINKDKLDYYDKNFEMNFKRLSKEKKILEDNIVFCEKEFKRIPIEHIRIIDDRKKQREITKHKAFMIFVYLLIFMIIANILKIAYRINGKK